MKKTILIAIAAIAAFVSCEKTIQNECPDIHKDSYWVFVSEKPAINADTKTAWDGTKVDWSVGDKIKIACYNSTRDKWQDQSGDATKNPKAYTSTALTKDDIQDGIASFTYQTKFAMNGGGIYRFYSFYPNILENSSSADIANAPVLTHASIKNEQPISSTSFDGSSDILVGISTNTYTAQPEDYANIELKWKRLVAFPVITFKNIDAEAGELVKSVTITAQEGVALTGAVDVNIYDGTIAASETRATYNSVKLIDKSGVALDSNKSFTTWLTTLPFTATSLKIEIVTTAAKYTRDIDLSSNNKQFVQNKRNLLAINMAEAKKEKESNVYANLEELVAAGKPTSVERIVTVTLTNEKISQKSSSYICVNVPTSSTTVQEVKLYKSGVPSQWAVGGTVSGTITCPWLLYNDVDWELQPVRWDDLTYTATKYTVAVAEGIANGTVSVDPTQAVNGQTVTITATPASGYKVKSVSAKTASGNALTVTNNKFTMPAENVTVNAEFEDNTGGSEIVYKTALFGSLYNSKKVSSYMDTFSATNDGFTVDLANFNNNNSGWGYVKTGNKTNASVGTITTNIAIDKAITKVAIIIDAVTASSVNSITLYSGSSDSCETIEGTFTVATGTQTVSISAPTENKFYKISFDCKKGSSNGLVQVSKVEYYVNAEE